MTELGDAELSEQNVMALSGHKTPDAARLYLKRTEKQRAIGARRRRVFLEFEERSEDKTRNGSLPGTRTAKPWCRLQDLNLRPPDYKSGALPLC
jgi:hypothetical protein